MMSDPRAKYALAVLLGSGNPELFPWPSWLIYGGDTQKNDQLAVHIIEARLFAEEYGTLASLPPLPLAEIDGVPLLFGKPSIERRDRTLVVHADIIASTYFLATRYEEWVCRDVRDEHGRFPGKESLPFRAGFIDRPLIDEYATLLRKWAGQVGFELPKPDRRFSVLLTHDVDSLGPSRGPLQAAGCIASGLLGRRNLRQAMRDAFAAGGLGRHPCDNLEEIVQLDQRLTGGFTPDRCRSMYFFMAGGSSLYDKRYRLRNRRVLRRIQHVLHSGADIGLHASYEAGLYPEHIAHERQTLEQVVKTRVFQNRHHFLALREPGDSRALAEAGIQWDSTLGYADVAGFRLGVCRPIFLFDPVAMCPLGIIEHPLIVMDCSLSMLKYMNIDEEAAFDYVRKLANTVSRHQGEFVTLWHNTMLAKNDSSYHKHLYPRILSYLALLLAGS